MIDNDDRSIDIDRRWIDDRCRWSIFDEDDR